MSRGSPLVYARALDLAFSSLSRRPKLKILDFGASAIGHLRMLAAMGHDVTGAGVSSMLRALYAAPGDQGEIRGFGGEVGRLRVLPGEFPADQALFTAVGTDDDLLVSKDVLRRGYIYPSRLSAREESGGSTRPTTWSSSRSSRRSSPAGCC